MQRRIVHAYTLPRVAGALVAGALACGGNGAPAAATGPPAGDVQITLTADTRFAPNDITIDPGTTVRWVAATSEFHTITPNNPQQPGVWSRVESSATGTVLTHAFTVPGQTYTYHCEPHLAVGMTGTIRVR